MSTTQFAAVQPRVVSKELCEPILLVDCLESILAREQGQVVTLAGDGKSTALKHLARHFSTRNDIEIRDEDIVVAATRAPAHVITTEHRADTNHILRLVNWHTDELIEYVLANHPRECRSIMARLRDANVDFSEGSPIIWQPILDALAKSEELDDVETIVMSELEDRLSRGGNVDKTSLATMVLKLRPSHLMAALHGSGLDRDAQRMLRLVDVQFLLTAEFVADRLRRKDPEVLKQALNRKVVDHVVKRIGSDRSVLTFLQRTVRRARGGSVGPSLLIRLQPDWRPADRRRQNISNAFLTNAKWSGCRLRAANITHTDLSNSEMSRVDLRQATLMDSTFRKSVLIRTRLDEARIYRCNFMLADLSGCQAVGASFWKTNLEKSSLESSNFANCRFPSTNLTKANCCNAVLEGCDLVQAQLTEIDLCNTSCQSARFDNQNLSSASLRGTDFTRALMRAVNFEGARLDHTTFTRAALENALFTGCTARSASFRNARLRGAGLAEIDWQQCDLRDADLRDVAFHMGSTRCGLVGSPYPSHGTRTGFYTDDYEDLYFKRPEEIRKASLFGCDLRGANIAGVDFYLVDLRQAKFDACQHSQFVTTGAILDHD